MADALALCATLSFMVAKTVKGREKRFKGSRVHGSRFAVAVIPA
jgi:hypothetical protein